MGDIIFDILETITSELQGKNKTPVNKQYSNQQRINATNKKQKKQATKENTLSQDTGVTDSIQKKQEQKQFENIPLESTSTLPDFSKLSNDDILRGIVFSELLSKPKSLRRGRL